MNMQKLSKHIIALANRERNGITNLELQKVMYFAIGSYIRNNGIDKFIRNIYDEPFEAWPYGPVVRSVYFDFKLNGRNKINIKADYNPKFAPLDQYIIKYLDVPIREMVEDSHKHEIWRRNKSKIMRHEIIEYELEDIENAFVD